MESARGYLTGYNSVPLRQCAAEACHQDIHSPYLRRRSWGFPPESLAAATRGRSVCQSIEPSYWLAAAICCTSVSVGGR